MNFSHLKFNFYQMTSDGEMTRTKVVDLDDIYNFVV
jgi:hypothetical protein